MIKHIMEKLAFKDFFNDKINFPGRYSQDARIKEQDAQDQFLSSLFGIYKGKNRYGNEL